MVTAILECTTLGMVCNRLELTVLSKSILKLHDIECMGGTCSCATVNTNKLESMDELSNSGL